MKFNPLYVLLGCLALALFFAQVDSTHATVPQRTNADGAFAVAYAGLLEPSMPQPARPYQQAATLAAPALVQQQRQAATPPTQAPQAKPAKSLPNVHTEPTYSQSTELNYRGGRKCRRGKCH